MRSINIADLHFALYSHDSIVPSSRLPERLHYLNQTFRNICDYARAKGIDSINILGDLIHTKSLIHTDAMTIICLILRDYQDLWFNILDGNHDMSSRSGQGTSGLTSLDNEPNVNVIHEPQIINNMLFVPWDLTTMIDTIKKGTQPFLFSHLGLNEAMLNSGISIVSDIGINDLTQYEIGFFGHYHKPQEIKKNGTRVIYVGSIMQMDFGERNEQKRFIIFDSETGQTDSIPTSGYKQYHALDLKSDNVSDILAQAKQLQEEGHFVRVDMLEKVDTTDFEGIRIVDKVDIDITNRGIDSTMSDEDKLKKYMDIHEIPEDERDLYLNVAKEIMSHATE